MNRRDGAVLGAWAALLALATHSVVRYRWWIVAGYVVVAAVVVACAVTTRDDRDRPAPRSGGWVPSAVLALVGLVHLTVAPFTYLTTGGRTTVQLVLGVAAFAVAGLLLPGRGTSRGLALTVAAAGAAAAGALVVTGDPAPRIDVWVVLQQAADAMARGESIYGRRWVGSPGISDAFAYLPWTAVLSAPGRWVAGDVRWAMLLLVLVSAVAVAAVGRWRRGAVGAAALLLLAPGSSTLVEQAWTEPTVLVGLALWAWLVRADRAWWSVVPLAVALAGKQHVVALLPLLAVWPRFGWRRAVVATGGAGLLVAPWALTGPAVFWHDTVETMLGLPPLRFADTLYTLVLNETGVQLPLPVVGVGVLAVLAAAVVTLRRRPVGLGGVLTWCAAVLLVANLLNKQAFYNQFWLVGALLLLAVAASAGALSSPGWRGRPERRARPAGPPAGASAPPSPSAG
ncbi:hypothetical protein [Kineococcus aurantiacus]|uniref:DUF2029 domain-containing protein n=1 Tax=Kineococcus aurantiacus TaxID=37633 RepID=A0A7Y9AV73_9ACTN|nr:hypothetical protein [Kineococcus aurantiacus]NYD21075.1 hypothetical protein [Kineococcus aurantiacus]